MSNILYNILLPLNWNLNQNHDCNCGAISTHYKYKYIFILAFATLKMTTWVAEICWLSVYNKITSQNKSDFYWYL